MPAHRKGAGGSTPHRAQISTPAKELKIVPKDTTTPESVKIRDQLIAEQVTLFRAGFKERLPHLVVTLNHEAQARIAQSCKLPAMPEWWWVQIEMHLENYRAAKQIVSPNEEETAVNAARRLKAALEPYCSKGGSPALLYELNEFLKAAEFNRKTPGQSPGGRPENHDAPGLIASLGSLWKYAMKRNPGVTPEGPFARFLIATLKEIGRSMAGRTIRKHVETLKQPPWHTSNGEWGSVFIPPHETHKED
jgi:hypothetical protein